MNALRRIGVSLVAAAAALVPAVASAQAWPTKPVRVVVTFSPGGSSDIVARLIAGPLGDQLGQTIVVDNKPGGGATIGAAEVARAAPDGYTWMLSNSAPISISPFMLAQPTYDPVKSFNHVFYIGSVANVFVVHPSVPAKNVNELIAWIKAQPNPVNYGSGGIGSIGHIVGETFKNQFGLRMEHVGYKGSSPMHNDLLGGQIKLAIDTLPQNVPYMKDNRLRALAVTSPERSPLVPDLPTCVEAGVPGLVAVNWWGVLMPAGTPKPVIDKFHGDLVKTMADPEVKRKFGDLGVDAISSSPEQFASFIKTETAKYDKLIKEAGIKVQ